MATAASKQDLTTEEKIFDAATDGDCTTFVVRCRSESAVDVLVRVEGLHAAGEWLAIPPGHELPFRRGRRHKSPGVGAVYAKGDGGTATVDYGKLVDGL